MKLYLMRHGEAASKEQDPAQGLTSQGKQAIEAFAEQMVQRGLKPQQVFHSTKTRAKQTAEIMLTSLNPEAVVNELAGICPNDPAEGILPKLDAWQHDTLLVSHLPFIPNLLSLLIDDMQDVVLVPGTLICLERDQHKSWHFQWQASP